MNSSIKFLKLWLPVIIWAGIIFWLSSIPELKTNLKYDYLLRKIAHTIEYFILTFLLYRGFAGTGNRKIFLLFAYPATLSFFYALSDEFHQSFVPGRCGSIRDVLIDSIGIFGFYAVARILLLNHKTKKLLDSLVFSKKVL